MGSHQNQIPHPYLAPGRFLTCALSHGGRRGQAGLWPKGCKLDAKVSTSSDILSLLSHFSVIPVTTSLLGTRAGSWLVHSPTEVGKAKSAFGPGDVSCAPKSVPAIQVLFPQVSKLTQAAFVAPESLSTQGHSVVWFMSRGH